MKRLYFVLFVVLCTFIFVTCDKSGVNPTQTPTTGTIQGVITNIITDSVLVGAVVTTTPAISSVSTNAQGIYTISNVSPGQYLVSATETGYNSRGVSVAVTAGETTQANIQLDYPIPTQGLVAYYPFNGNTNDESGNGNNGVNNGAILSADRFGNLTAAYSFNGSSNIQIPTTMFPSGNSPRTISLWYYTTTTPMNVPSYKWWCLFSYGTASTANAFSAFTYSSNATTYGIRCDEGNMGFNGSLDLSLSKWNHIVLVYTGNTTFIYENGTLETSQAQDINTTLSTGFIGSWLYTSTFPFYAVGSIDDMCIYNRVLSSTEIQILYHEGGW
jgi:trimeric autotransporter adhesin